VAGFNLRLYPNFNAGSGWGQGNFSGRWLCRCGHLLELRFPIFEDRHGGGGAKARASSLIDFERFFECTDAAGRFDLDVGIGVRPHQAQIFESVASRGKTGGGLDEIRAGAAADAARDDLQLIGEIGVLEDHFEDGALFVAGCGHLLYLRIDVLELPRKELGDVDDHVHFARAAPQQIARFVELGGRGARTVRETGHAAYGNAAAFHLPHGEIHIARPHGDAGHLILPGDAASFGYLLLGQLRPQEGVVDHFGEVFVLCEWGTGFWLVLIHNVPHCLNCVRMFFAPANQSS
jgi:hypothetical protein